MAFTQITSKEIGDIVRKYGKGQSIKSIAEETGHDRKTVRKYIRAVEAKVDLKNKEEVKKAIKEVLPKKPGRPKKVV